MLRTRVLTAALLLLLLVPALFFLSPTLWAWGALAVLLVSAWEWARIAKFVGGGVWVFVLLTGAAGALLHTGDPLAVQATYAVALVFWFVAVPTMFVTGARPSGWLAAVTGWCVILPFGLAVVDLRGMDPWLLIFLMGFVWVADIAAYFSGRRFGIRKLAPSISPGKTWEGVAGAVVATTLYVLVNVWLGNPWIAGPADWRVIFLIAILLTTVSIIGDLFESAMKRSAGIKDSSQLLPGHGGVLDRVDSLTSTLPVAACMLIWDGKL